ncbi:ABC transporter permease [Salinibacterium sp. NK8237]|uniref:ABC transporter permease n=1 Tax=Salinibacterium sp. NK8237 TaxID=2792038 RepID=UPI0018CDB646|nr:ABC transporter permease [Salinibacterium sp. NK8237]MBH0130096.1 ABC transporter permease [Salinibacterium sp. NK8237]
MNRISVARHETTILVAKGVAGIVIAVTIWELLRTLNVIPASIVPPTLDVVSTAVREFAAGDLTAAFIETLSAWSAGLLVTILIAVPLGVIVGLSRWADAATSISFDLIRPIPAVALVPVAVVLLGLGQEMQVALVVLAAVWPLLYNTRYGVRNVDRTHLDAARVSGVNGWPLIARVVLPSALPSMFTGLRLSAGIALIVTVVTELVASGTGLGRYISISQQAGLNSEAMAGVLVAALLGLTISGLVGLIEKRALRWHHGLSKAASE